MLKRTFFLCILLLCSVQIFAQNVLPRPERYTPVIDKGGLLKPEQFKALTDKLLVFEKETSNQVVIIVLENLNGLTVDEYSNALFTQWGIGAKGKDNGVLILISKSPRKLRIEVGNGLEPAISDGKSIEIRSAMAKKMASQKYYEALNDAVTEITQLAKQEFNDPKPKTNKKGKVAQKSDDSSGGWVIIVIIILIVLLIYWLIRSSKNKGGNSGGSSYNSGSYRDYSDYSSTSSTVIVTPSYRDYSDYSDKSSYSDYSDTSSYSDYSDTSSYSDSSWGGGDSGGGGSSGDW